MLDAGSSKEYNRDIYNSNFETIRIRELLSSPDYLGRSYKRTPRNTEKYIKNKEICDLIDRLRYKTTPCIQDEHEHRREYNNIDGGCAGASYRFLDKISSCKD
jgi:hypothetical protein